LHAVFEALVVIPALDQVDAASVDSIDQAMFLRDPARPRVDRFQPLRLAKPGARVARDALEQFQDLGPHTRLRLNPKLEIFEESRVND
jgi:hypothetical protein